MCVRCGLLALPAHTGPSKPLLLRQIRWVPGVGCLPKYLQVLGATGLPSQGTPSCAMTARLACSWRVRVWTLRMQSQKVQYYLANFLTTP